MPWYQSYRDWQLDSREGGPSLAQALPGNLSVLGQAFLRSVGKTPSYGVNTPQAPDAELNKPPRPPRSYDPNWFIPQGNAPATPTANANVAAQSQVVRTPQEIQAQIDKQNKSLQAASKEQRQLQQLWDAYRNGFGNFSSAIQGELAGRQTVVPPGDIRMEGITLNPGAVGMYMPDITNGNGQAYIAVPNGFEATTPGGQSGAYSLDGLSRTPLINRDYANALADTIRSQMRAGGPVVADPVAPQSGSLPVSPGLMQREPVQTALNNWTGAYQQLQNVPKDYLGRPVGLGGSSGSSSPPGPSYDSFMQGFNSNKITENQAYLDQMGGGFFGGVTPWAQNPQWTDTTPTFDPRAGEIGERKAQTQAQNSPWGQPGAPWQSQAWASGMFNPNEGQRPTGTDGQQPQWTGQSGMFAPQYGFNPSLVTNAPWTPPRQQNNAFGATSTPGMTFGASPWGSFW